MPNTNRLYVQAFHILHMSLVQSSVQWHCITWSILLYCGWLSSLTERGYRYSPYLFYHDYRSLWNSHVYLITLQKHKALRFKQFQAPYYNRNRRRKVMRFTLENRIQLLKNNSFVGDVHEDHWPAVVTWSSADWSSIITVIDLWHLPHDTNQLPLLYTFMTLQSSSLNSKIFQKSSTQRCYSYID